jgi:hypothetical protein
MSVNTDQKIIKNKVGLLKLADMLGSVSQPEVDGVLAGQLLSLQGVVRQGRRSGLAGDQPPQALLEESH